MKKVAKELEVVGHLIDSAQNNLRRFVCGHPGVACRRLRKTFKASS